MEEEEEEEVEYEGEGRGGGGGEVGRGGGRRRGGRGRRQTSKHNYFLSHDIRCVLYLVFYMTSSLEHIIITLCNETQFYTFLIPSFPHSPIRTYPDVPVYEIVREPDERFEQVSLDPSWRLDCHLCERDHVV